MKIKEEYVVFGYKAEINSTYHYRLEKGRKSDEYVWRWRGRIPYADDNVFPTGERALAFASEVAGKSSVTLGRPAVIESDYDSYVRVARSGANAGQYVIFVIRVPVSRYIGEVWAQTLNEIGNNRYTDDKPCQVYRRGRGGRRLYLRRGQCGADEWTEDKWRGSFFTPKEAAATADEFCRAARGKLPGSFRAWTATELIRPDEGREPAFEKGDEVYTLPSECWPCTGCRRGRRRTVTDIKVEMDSDGNKEFVYEVTGIDGFLPQGLLLSKERITSEGGRFYRGWFNGRREDLLDYKGNTYTAY